MGCSNVTSLRSSRSHDRQFMRWVGSRLEEKQKFKIWKSEVYTLEQDPPMRPKDRTFKCSGDGEVEKARP